MPPFKVVSVFVVVAVVVVVFVSPVEEPLH